MKALCALVLVVVVAGGCTSSSQMTMAGSQQGEEETPAAAATAAKPTSIAATAPAAVTEGSTAPPAAGDDMLLLTAEDVPGRQYVRAMSFDAEPSFVGLDCDLMNSAWAAHREPGIRVRANADDLRIRNSVITMADEAAATAVLDAVDEVWQQCPLVETDIGPWWVEPVEIDAPAGWRAGALALGVADDMTWIIGYWQRGATIVLVDIDSANPWNSLESIFASVGGRVSGAPLAVPPPEVPGSAAPTTTALRDATPLSTPAPSGETTPRPTATPRPGLDWSTHPLAELIPTGPELGRGWTIEGGTVSQAHEGGLDEDLPLCDVPEPPQPEGIEVWYDNTATGELGQIEIHRGTVDGMRTVVPSFRRAFTECDVSPIGLFDATVRPLAPRGADDAIAIVGSAIDADAPLRFVMGVATYETTTMTVLWGIESDSEPDIERGLALVTTWIELVAAKR